MRCPSGQAAPIRSIRRLTWVLAVMGHGIAVPTAGAQSPAETERPIVVLAASSLTDVLPDVARLWSARGNPAVQFSFDATSRLAPQAARGAPADVFVSADRAWMQWLDKRGGIVAPTWTDIASNRLVLVVPSSGEYQPRSVEELTDGRLTRLGLAGESVPAGRYARAALEAVGVWDAVSPSVVNGGSVRGTLEWVARGDVDAAVVFQSDALAEARVTPAFPLPQPEEDVVYPAAVLTGARSIEDATRFVAYLASPEAQASFRRAGFEPPPPPTQTGPSRQGPMVDHPSSWSAVRLSLIVATIVAVLGFVPAVWLGRLLARHRFPGKSLVSTTIMAPLVFPPVVTGFLLLSVFGRRGPAGAALEAAGISISFTLLGAVLAALIVGLPLYVMAARGAFESVDTRFEEVSLTLGVPPRATFFRVGLPLALPGIAAGAVLAFARALGEFGATVVLAGNVEGRTRTIALAVYTLLESPSGEAGTWLLVGASVALAALALLGYEALSQGQRRRIEDR